MLDAVHGPDLARETDLAGEAGAAVDGEVDAGGEHGADDGQVDGRVTDSQSAGDVEEDVLLDQLEPGALLEYGQEHVHASQIEARGAALRRGIDGAADERLGLDEERSRTFDGRCDGYAAQPFVVLRQEQLRGVVNLAEAALAHFVDAQLGGAAKAVLDAAQDAVHVLPIALELQHRVHDVLQNLRPGQAPFLINMPDHEDRCARLFGELEDGRAALPDLRDAARRRLGRLGVHRLDRVDDHQVGPESVSVGEDLLEVRLAIDVAVRHDFGAVGGEAVGAHLELAGALLAGDVERVEVGEAEDGLEDERRLANAGFAAHEDERSADESAAQDAVQLRVVHIDAHLLLGGDVAQELRPGVGATDGSRGASGGRFGADDLLHIRIPCAARGAFAHPFG